MSEGNDKPTECDCCQFSPVAVTRYTSQFPREPAGAWYCDLCAGTMTSRPAVGPSEYQIKEVMKTICHVGNAILAAVRSR